MQIVRRLAERDLDAEVVRERRLDHLLLHLAVERDGQLLPEVVLAHVDQRVLLGELRRARRAARACRRRGRGTTTVSSVGGAKWCSGACTCGSADHVADPHVAEAPELPDPAGVERRHAARPAAVEDADRGHLPLVADRRSAAGRAPAPCRRTGARRRSCSPAAPRSILKTVPETGPSGSPVAAGSSSAMPALSASTPAPVIAEPKNTGCTSARPVCAPSASRSLP